MPLRRFLALPLLMALLLAGCSPASSPTPAAPTATARPAPAVEQAVPQDSAPTPEVIAPADATVVVPTEPEMGLATPGPYATATLQKLPSTCLNEANYGPVVTRYLAKEGKADLKELWEAFDKDTPVYGLMASLTDSSNEHSFAMTYSKMLLVGEYKIAINRPGAVGYAHCAVLIYQGGDEPEIGVGVLDATINDTWSGYAYGIVRSEQELRAYIKQRIGKPVLVRYHVMQDPRDVDFVRTGFFSPTMRLLWENSYYTRFAANPQMLKDGVQTPRAPSMNSLMVLLTAWPDQDIGIFLDYLIDPIL